MKKKSFRSLKLNKKIISKFEESSTRGGYTIRTQCNCPPLTQTCPKLPDPDPTVVQTTICSDVICV